MNYTKLLPLSCLTLLSSGLMACGPSLVHVDPRDVTALSVKVPTQEPTFCPGDPIQLEVRAELKDGSTCSSSDAGLSCMGKKGALIDAGDIRVQGSAGALKRSGDDFLWIPPRDALVTAATGLSLRAFIASTVKGATAQSPTGQLDLRPVYQCLQENVFTIPPPSAPSESGRPGPDLKVSATLISTPFYPEVLLVRVENGERRTYIMSADRKRRVTILSKGQNGSAGLPGRNGTNGMDGEDGSAYACERGRNGFNGMDGGHGGNGGDGGPGGKVQLFVDEAAAEKVQEWLSVGSVGGDAGPAGGGGAGGQGGRGGTGSQSKGCTATTGENGKGGVRGADGRPGRPGSNGPHPTISMASRPALFGDDMAVIQRLESATKPRSDGAGKGQDS